MAKNLESLYQETSSNNSMFSNSFESYEEFQSFVESNDEADTYLKDKFGIENVRSYELKKKEDFASESLSNSESANLLEVSYNTEGAEEIIPVSSQDEVQIGTEDGVLTDPPEKKEKPIRFADFATKESKAKKPVETIPSFWEELTEVRSEEEELNKLKSIAIGDERKNEINNRILEALPRQDKVNGRLNVEVNKMAEEAYKTMYNNVLTPSDTGMVMLDETKQVVENPYHVIQNIDSYLSGRFDIPEEFKPELKKKIKRVVDSKIESEILKEPVNQLFNKKVQEAKESGKIVGDLVDIERASREIDNKLNGLYTKEQDLVNTKTESVMDGIQEDLELKSDELDIQTRMAFDALRYRAENGEIDEQTYKNEFDNLKETYVKDFDQLNDYRQSRLKEAKTEISMYIESLEDNRPQKYKDLGVDKLIDKYSPEGVKQSLDVIQNIYEESYDEAASNRFEKRLQLQKLQFKLDKKGWVTDRIQARSASFFKNAIEASKVVLGEDNPLDYFTTALEYVHNRNQTFVRPVSEAKDFTEGVMGIASSLIDQAPNLILGVGVGALTKSATAGALYSWGSDTIENMGDNRAIAFDVTGSLKKANQASIDTFTTQMGMAPLYWVQSTSLLGRFSGARGGFLNFVGKEYIPELATELVQNYRTAKIQSPESNENFFQYTSKNAPKLAIDILPSMLVLSGTGEVVAVRKEMKRNKQLSQVQSFLQEKGFTQLFMDAYDSLGTNGALAVPQYLYQTGQITESQYVKVSEVASDIVSATSAVKDVDMSEDQRRYFVSNLGKRSKMQRVMNQTENPQAKEIMKAEIAKMDKKLNEIKEGKDKEFSTLTFSNGIQITIGNEEFSSIQIGDASLEEMIITGDVVVDSSNDAIQKRVNEINQNNKEKGSKKVKGILTGENKNATDVSNNEGLQQILKNVPEEEKRNEIIDAAKRAQFVLSQIAPGAKIMLHDNDSYMDKMKTVKGKATSNGNFSYKKNVDGSYGVEVQINAEKANAGTIFHELGHVALLEKFGNSAEEFGRLKNVLSSVISSDVNNRLNDFVKNYNYTERSEEFLAEFTSIFMEDAEEMSQGAVAQIAMAINAIMRKITGGRYVPFKNINNKQEVINFFNDFQNKLNTAKDAIQEQTTSQVPLQQEAQVGQEVEERAPEAELEDVTEAEKEVLEEGVSEEINTNAPPTEKEVDTSSIESKSSLIQDLGLERFPEMKGRIVLNKKLSDYPGITAHLTFSDRLATGRVGDKTYLGGILFGAATNRVWASFSPGRVNTIINNTPKNKDGYRYLMPALLTEESHMSNKDMLNTSLQLVEKSVLDGEITPSEANKRIERSLSRKGLEKFKDIYTSLVQKSITPENIKNGIEEALVNSSSTFEQRKSFLESLLGKANIDLSKRFGNIPSFNELAKGLAEPITDGFEYGDVLLMIRTKGDLKAVQPKPGDEDYHPSYPWVIRSSDNVETIVFKNAYNAVDIFPQVTNKKGNTLTYKDYVNKYGDGAKSRYLGYIGGRSTMSTSLTEEVKVSASPTSTKIETKGLESKSQKVVKVYHGGTMNLLGDNFYVASDRGQAEYYASQNQGEVIEGFIDVNKLAPEEVVKDMITEKGLFPEDYQKDELMIPELLDQRFDETALSRENSEAIIQELKDIGYLGISFLDQDILQERKGGVQNYFIFNPNTLAKTKEEVGGIKANGFQSKSQLTEPSSNAWKTSLTQAQVDEVVGGDFGATLDEKVKEGKKHNTQIATTVNTYKKWNEWLGKNVPEFKNAKVLDVGAGLGHVHKAFQNNKENIQSYEPFYDKVQYQKYSGKKTPDFSALDASDVPTEQYDVVVNNAVLNVVPSDIRESIVNTIGAAMKPGGIGIINVMKQDYLNSLIKKIDAGTSKNIKLSDTEVFVRESGKNTYQKGWKATELQSYVQDVLGPDFSVEIAPRAITSGPTILIRKGQEMGSKAQIDELVSESKKMKVPQRYKGDVGKFIGGDLYVHKSAMDVLPQTEMKKAESKLPADFNYEVVKYNSKTKAFSFIASPDWDTNPEPVVGDAYKVSAEGNVSVTKQKADPQIYHHKWNFVRDDYAGFDVAESIQRSIDWFGSVKPKVNMYKIGTQSYWQNEALPNLEVTDKEFESKAQINREDIIREKSLEAFKEYESMPQDMSDMDKMYELSKSYDFEVMSKAFGTQYTTKDFNTGKSLYDEVTQKRFTEDLEKKAEGGMQGISSNIRQAMEQDPFLSISDMRSMLLEKGFPEYLVFKEMKDWYDFTESSTKTEDQIDLENAFGLEYRKTIDRALEVVEDEQSAYYDRDDMKALEEDARSLKLQTSINDLTAVAHESGLGFVDAATYLNVLSQKMEDAGLGAGAILRSMIKEGANNEVDLKEVIQAFSRMASVSGRFLNMARNLFDTELNELIEESINVKTGRVLTNKDKATLKALTDAFSAAKNEFKQAQEALLEDMSDENFRKFERLRKSYDDTAFELDQFVKSKAPVFWNEKLTSASTRALLGLQTIWLSVVSNMENLGLSAGPIARTTGSLVDRLYGKEGRSMFMNPRLQGQAARASFNPASTQMFSLFKRGAEADAKNVDKWTDSVGSVNFFKDYEAFGKAVDLLMTKNRFGKPLSDMTPEEKADAFGVLLLKAKDGTLVTDTDPRYKVVAQMFSAIAGTIPEATGRLMVLGADKAVSIGAAYRSLTDFLQSIKKDGSYKGTPFESLFEKGGDIDSNMISKAMSILEIYGADDVFQEEGLRRAFLADNLFTAKIASGRAAFRKGFSIRGKKIRGYEQRFADIKTAEKAGLFQRAKLLGFQLADVGFWSLSPFTRVPFNVVSQAVVRSNPATVAISWWQKDSKYKKLKKEFDEKYMKDGVLKIPKDKKEEFLKDKVELFGARRRATNEISHLPASAAYTTLGLAAYTLGALIPAGDDEEAMRKAYGNSRVKPGTLNASLLFGYFTDPDNYNSNFMSLEQMRQYTINRGGAFLDDDKVYDFRNMGIFGITLGLMSSGLYGARRMAKKTLLEEGEEVYGLSNFALDFVAGGLGQIPTLQGISRVTELFSGTENFDSKIERFAGDFVATSSAMFAPSLLSVYSKAEAERVQSMKDVFDHEEYWGPNWLGRVFHRAVTKLNRNLSFLGHTEFYKSKIGAFGEELQYRTTTSEPGTIEAYLETIVSPFQGRLLKPGFAPANKEQRKRYESQKAVYELSLNLHEGLLRLSEIYVAATNKEYVSDPKDPTKNVNIFKYLTNDLGNDFKFDKVGTFKLPNEMYRAELRKRGDLRYQSIPDMIKKIDDTKKVLRLNSDNKDVIIQEIEGLFSAYESAINAADNSYKDGFNSNSRNTLQQLYLMGILKGLNLENAERQYPNLIDGLTPPKGEGQERVVSKKIDKPNDKYYLYDLLD